MINLIIFIFYKNTLTHDTIKHINLKNPGGLMRRQRELVTQAEACCKQPLNFLYLLPQWVGSRPSSTFHSSFPQPPLPALARSSTCLQASRSARLCGSQKFNFPTLAFLPFSPPPAVMLAPHPLPTLTSPVHAPALTLPHPLLLPFLILSHTHFLEDPPRLQPGFWQMLIRDEAEVARPYKLFQE